jgi:lysophospholipase L1-like esterase
MSIFNIRVQSDGDVLSILSVTKEDQEPAPVSKKIVFIGDSNTAPRPANGINQVDTYSQKIGNARGFGTVVNAGIGGQTAVQMQARFQTDVIAQSPDHVHIDGGVNGALAGGLTPAQHGAAVRSMAQMCVDAGVPFTLCTPWMVKQTDYINCMDAYNDQVRLVAADFGAPLVDVYEEVIHLYFMNNGGTPFTEKYIAGDNQHASLLGHTFRAAIYSKPHNWRACKLPA